MTGIIALLFFFSFMISVTSTFSLSSLFVFDCNPEVKICGQVWEEKFFNQRPARRRLLLCINKHDFFFSLSRLVSFEALAVRHVKLVFTARGCCVHVIPLSKIKRRIFGLSHSVWYISLFSFWGHSVDRIKFRDNRKIV